MTHEHTSNESANADRKRRLDVVRLKMRSQRPSDIFGAMLEARTVLQENVEAHEVYEILLDAVRDNPGLRRGVHSLLEEMIQKGSKTAAQALRVLPADIKDLMADADDAYYTADYDQAIELYRQVLEKDSANVRAREQLAKAELNRIAGMPDTELPRTAIQLFRRARSHIAARDFLAATNLLNAALEEAKARGMHFDEANELLQSIERLVKSNSQKELKSSTLSGSRIRRLNIVLLFLAIAILTSVFLNLEIYRDISGWGLLLLGVVSLLWSVFRLVYDYRAPNSTTESPFKEPKKGAPSEADWQGEAQPPLKEPPFKEEDNSSEEITFTAYYPKEGKVNTWYTLLVYTHILSGLDKVRKDAGRFIDEIKEPKEVTLATSTTLVRGTEIDIVPSCEGITFNPDHITLKWIEDFHRADFRFKADSTLASDAAKGQIDIFAGPLIIGSLKFALLLNNKDGLEENDCEEHAKMYSKDDVFISYSRKDKDVARAFKNILEATGLDVFLDVDDIRAGQYWQGELLRRIERAKIFQIFWSSNYSESENCRLEWEYALKQNKKEGYIRPVFWKNPLSPKPPKELDKFNFRYVELKLPEM